MISSEKCLEIWHEQFPSKTTPDGTLEALINCAYAEGQKDMRERAKRLLEDCGYVLADSELEIE